MKKAFMRGVCALNLEAMNMFHEQPDGGPPSRAAAATGYRPAAADTPSPEPTPARAPQPHPHPSMPEAAPQPRDARTPEAVWTSQGQVPAGAHGSRHQVGRVVSRRVESVGKKVVSVPQPGDNLLPQPTHTIPCHRRPTAWLLCSAPGCFWPSCAFDACLPAGA